MAAAVTALPPPPTTSPRFTLELEFVLSLSNPYYLQHLATAYPHLFTPSTSTSTSTSTSPTTSDTDATKFAAYLSYLYGYWRTPAYAKFLTHPAAVLNTLRLLQEERFRAEVIRPDVVEALLRGGDRAEGTKEGGETEETKGGGVGEEQGERMDEGAG